MVTPDDMLRELRASDFLGLLIEAGMTPNDFGKRWGVSGSLAAKMCNGGHRVMPWAMRAALYELGCTLAMPPDVTHAREVGQRHVGAGSNSAGNPKDLPARVNSRRFDVARAQRTKGLTREQRSARRAGYDID